MGVVDKMGKGYTGYLKMHGLCIMSGCHATDKNHGRSYSFGSVIKQQSHLAAGLSYKFSLRNNPYCDLLHRQDRKSLRKFHRTLKILTGIN